jgi:hypothetical protein
MTPTLPSGVPSKAKACSNDAPSGFQNNAFHSTGRPRWPGLAEVAELMAKAEAADAADIPDGMSIPDELARREERWNNYTSA